LSILIAYFLGRKRQIGFGWSLFFCLFLSPLGGFITTMLSRKYYDSNPKPSNLMNIFGWGLIVIFTLVSIVEIQRYIKFPGNQRPLLGFSLGLAGLGVYLVGLSKGKNFNSSTITKMDK
jgi:hypothetical protein